MRFTIIILTIVLHYGLACAQSDIIVFNDTGYASVYEGANIRVLIDNQSEDSCWSNDNIAKTAVELELKRSGFTTKDEFSSLSAVLKVLAYETSSTTCVASFHTDINIMFVEKRFENDSPEPIKSFLSRTLWSTTGVLSGAKSQQNQRLKETFIENIQSFLNQYNDRKEELLEEILADEDALETTRQFWKNVLE